MNQLPDDPNNYKTKRTLSCDYYPNFVVKEIDSDSNGADQLSIIPLFGNHLDIAVASKTCQPK